MENTPKKKIEMIVSPWLCLACHACESACPTGAVRVTDAADIDQKLCIGCGSCAGRCPTGAIESPIVF